MIPIIINNISSKDKWLLHIGDVRKVGGTYNVWREEIAFKKTNKNVVVFDAHIIFYYDFVYFLDHISKKYDCDFSQASIDLSQYDKTVPPHIVEQTFEIFRASGKDVAFEYWLSASDAFFPKE